MRNRLPTDLPSIDQHVLGRTTSFFEHDLEMLDGQMHSQVTGRRVLIIGGAGTIGSSTLQAILAFGPSVVHIIDHNENALAELVRSLRSSSDHLDLPELSFLPFDVGGEPFRLWMASTQVGYDLVLNFSALKHVRTEKDPFAILAMLQTNVLYLDRLARLLVPALDGQRVFSVSTDKAANPSSVMGATKRLMEHALFLPSQPWPSSTVLSSARFANVAFSNGSLLQSWQYRMAAHQPLAVPRGTRRFFISIRESGHLCALAALNGRDHFITIPALDPGKHLVLLTDVVSRFLDYSGYEASFTEDPDEAVARVHELVRRRLWPVLTTPLDTSGEKPYEEFVAVGEVVEETSAESLHEVRYVGPADPASFSAMTDKLRAMLASHEPSAISTDNLRALIASVEPEFADTHQSSAETLDERM